MSGGDNGAIRMWSRLWRNLAPAERRRLKQASAAMVVGSGITAAVPLAVGTFVDAVYRDGRLVGLDQAITPLLLLIGAYCAISGLEVVRHQKVHIVTTGFECEARQKIYAALLRWDLKRFREGSDGAIYGRANRSVEGAERLIKLGASDLLPAVLVALFGVTLAIAKYGLTGLVMAMVIPSGFAMVVWQIRSQNGVRVMLKNAKERIDGSVVAWLTMIKVIRTSGTEPYFDRRIHQQCDSLRETELRHHVAMSLFDAGKAVNEAAWLVISLLITITLSSATSPGDVAGMVLIYFAITKPLRELHRVIDESSEASLQAKDLLDDLTIPRDKSFDDPGRRPLKMALSASPAAAVSFDDVIFQYPDTPAPTLRGITTRIEFGERVGIVGASGCGKSTMLDLLARLHHGHTGQVLIHGRRVEDIPRSELVALMGYVGQEPTLFPGTIRDNLLLGRDTINDAELDDACRRANIMPDIRSSPDGYDTQVSQRGGNLSGGQRQRLCIARALLRTPSVMLLDEPTSALDGLSQAVVQAAIDELHDVTMLVVAHRLSTLKTMDRILVLQDGRIVEDGTYEELEAAGKQFTRMLESEKRTAVPVMRTASTTVRSSYPLGLAP